MVCLVLMFHWLGAFEGLELNNRKHLTQSRWNFVCLWLSLPVSVSLFELQGCSAKFSAEIVAWKLKTEQLTALRTMQREISGAALLCSLSPAIPEVQGKSNCFVTFSHRNAASPQPGIEQTRFANLRERQAPWFSFLLWK